jgi:polar amino acid transport system permease protein
MDWNVMKTYLPKYWDALLLTAKIGWEGIVLALLIGVLCALVLHLKVPVLRRVVQGYIELFRNTPLLVQLFFLYFALPKVGVRISAQACGSLGLALLGGAYMAETFRSGLENIPVIQTESAQSLGMNRPQVFWHVVLPQAVSSSVPGLLANVIFLLKETSVFSVVSLMDLMFTAKDLIGMYAKTIECLTLLVVFYLLMLLPVSILGRFAERRLRHAEFGDRRPF